VTGVTSGYAEIDRITAGFQPGELIILLPVPVWEKLLSL
jgi:replicative DNA helicase